MEVGMSFEGSGPRAVVQKDEISVEALLRSHFDDVYRWAGRLLGPGALGPELEAVSSRVFVAAHGQLPSLGKDRNLGPWLRRLTARTVLSYTRSFARELRFGRTLRSRSDVDPELARTWKGLLTLSPEQRVVYLLHEVEGLSGSDIGDALDLSAEAVWKQLYQARKHLVHALGRME
jgi:RNA polymerase sigma factor (sigma-70 family)